MILNVKVSLTLCNNFAIGALVVQSAVSLTNSLRGQLIECFTTLERKTLIFFVEKMSFSHFFNKNYWHIILRYQLLKF